MSGKNTLQRHGAQERVRCQVDYLFGGTSCAEPASVEVDGLVLCDGHALEARLEGQIACWDEVLFHVDLWSREAGRRERPRVVELLGVRRAEVTSAIKRARANLERARGETSRGSRGGRGPLEGAAPLFL